MKIIREFAPGKCHDCLKDGPRFAVSTPYGMRALCRRCASGLVAVVHKPHGGASDD